MIMKSYPYPHKFFFIQKTLPKCAQADQCLAGCGPASPLLFARQSCTRLSRVPISDSSRLVGPHQISVHSSTISGSRNMQCHCNTELSPTRNVYTKHLFQLKCFTPGALYTASLLHQKPFTPARRVLHHHYSHTRKLSVF